MPSASPIQLNTPIRRSSNLVSSEIASDDIVILSIEHGRYYGTQVVGKRIWALLEEPTKADDICNTLLQEFKVDRVTCEQEVLAFLLRLLEEGLIEAVS